jgi:hypothetical protein
MSKALRLIRSRKLNVFILLHALCAVMAFGLCESAKAGFVPDERYREWTGGLVCLLVPSC